MQEEGIVYQYSQKAIRASTYKSESWLHLTLGKNGVWCYPGTNDPFLQH
jgi:hypothetical protein